MFRLRKIILSLLILIIGSGSVGVVHADSLSDLENKNPILKNCPAGQENSPNCGLGAGLKQTEAEVDNDLITANVGVKELIIGWVNWLLGFLFLIAVLIVIYAGVIYLNPREEKKEKAAKMITNAIIGIIIIFFSYAIVNFVLDIML